MVSLSSPYVHDARSHEPKIIINKRRSPCKVYVILVRYEGNLNFLDIFEKYSNIKFHEYPSGAGRAGGRTDVRNSGLADRQTDMTKLIVAFRNFGNGPKKPSVNVV